MTADFDRTAHFNHQCLTEIQRILTEHYWLCFDRTTFLTEHFGKLGFDRTVNGKMFCQKDALLGVFCRIWTIKLSVSRNMLLVACSDDVVWGCGGAG